MTSQLNAKIKAKVMKHGKRWSTKMLVDYFDPKEVNTLNCLGIITDQMYDCYKLKLEGML